MKPFKRAHSGTHPSSSSAAWRKIHRGGDRLEFRGGSTHQIELPEEEDVEWEEDYEYYPDDDGYGEDGGEYEYYDDENIATSDSAAEDDEEEEGYYYADEYNDGEEDIDGYYNDDAEEGGFLYLPDDEYASVVEEVSLMDFILWCSGIEGRGDQVLLRVVHSL